MFLSFTQFLMRILSMDQIWSLLSRQFLKNFFFFLTELISIPLYYSIDCFYESVSIYMVLNGVFMTCLSSFPMLSFIHKLEYASCIMCVSTVLSYTTFKRFGVSKMIYKNVFLWLTWQQLCCSIVCWKSTMNDFFLGFF